MGYRFLLVRECGLQDMRGAYSACPQIPVFHITYLHVGCTLMLVTLMPIQQTCDEIFFQYDIACLTILYRPGQFVRWNCLPVEQCCHSCLHPHLHLHWWSCHHCLLEERWHNAQWWQQPWHHVSSDRSSDSHLHPYTDSDWETCRTVSVQCVQHQNTFRN